MGTSSPWLRRKRTRPSGTALVEKSATTGSVVVGKAYTIGFVPSRPSRVPNHATLWNRVGTEQNASATNPLRANASTYTPIRPRWPAFRSDTTPTPDPSARRADGLDDEGARDLPEAPVRVDDQDGPVIVDDGRRRRGIDRPGRDRVEVVGDADDAVRVQSDEARVDEVIDDRVRVLVGCAIRSEQLDEKRAQSLRLDRLGHFARRSSRLSFASHNKIWFPHGSRNAAW